MTPAPRYALYWAPDRRHPLWRAGCDWLGRDPEQDSACPPPHPHTDEPRRYGLHATLKPPMQLAEGRDEAGFIARAREIASDLPGFPMPALAVSRLDRFVALRPVEPIDAAHPLRRLADAFVLGLDAWRRPFTPAQLDDRLRARAFDARQADHLRRYGYAYVMDCWRFHVTLTDFLPEEAAGDAVRARLVDEAGQHFAAALAQPLRCDSVAIFIEDAPGRPFRLARRIALGR